ncbi:MAG: T9SS type A sorting domain-containing protein [bacterium]
MKLAQYNHSGKFSFKLFHFLIAFALLSPTTKIKFTIAAVETPYPDKSGQVMGSLQLTTLKIYDILGREIATLVNEYKSLGTYEVEFDGTGLPSGIYFYQLRVGEFSEVRKMSLIK